MRGFAVLAAVTILAACGTGAGAPNQAPIALSDHARQQAETVARHMLAGTYNDADAAPAANCARELASDGELFALIDAPRDEARRVFGALYARPAVRNCIEKNNVTWRPLA